METVCAARAQANGNTFYLSVPFPISPHKHALSTQTFWLWNASSVQNLCSPLSNEVLSRYNTCIVICSKHDSLFFAIASWRHFIVKEIVATFPLPRLSAVPALSYEMSLLIQTSVTYRHSATTTKGELLPKQHLSRSRLVTQDYVRGKYKRDFVGSCAL